MNSGKTILGSIAVGFTRCRSTRPSACNPTRLWRSTTLSPKRGYPEQLQRIRYFDTDSQKRLVLLTNNFLLPTLTRAESLSLAGGVVLSLDQAAPEHLRIKAFFGTSENAVKTQIWVALSVYVLVAIVKKRLDLDRSLHSILQVLSLSV